MHPLPRCLALVFATLALLLGTLLSGTAAAASSRTQHFGDVLPQLQLSLGEALIATDTRVRLDPIVRAQDAPARQPSGGVGFGVTLFVVGGLVGIGLKSRPRPVPQRAFPQAETLTGASRRPGPADLTTRRE